MFTDSDARIELFPCSCRYYSGDPHVILVCGQKAIGPVFSQDALILLVNDAVKKQYVSKKALAGADAIIHNAKLPNHSEKDSFPRLENLFQTVVPTKAEMCPERDRLPHAYIFIAPFFMVRPGPTSHAGLVRIINLLSTDGISGIRITGPDAEKLLQQTMQLPLTDAKCATLEQSSVDMLLQVLKGRYHAGPHVLIDEQRVAESMPQSMETFLHIPNHADIRQYGTPSGGEPGKNNPLDLLLVLGPFST
jgi:hypothetical protein